MRARNADQQEKVLHQLIWDCEQCGFTRREALLYIKLRYKEIGERTYYTHKAKLRSGEYTNKWLNHFTRVGFVVSQQGLIENTQRILKSSNRRLIIEEQKQIPDEQLILKLKEDIRQSLRLLESFNVGTPVISAIKAKLQNDNKLGSDQRSIRISDTVPAVE